MVGPCNHRLGPFAGRRVDLVSPSGGVRIPLRFSPLSKWLAQRVCSAPLYFTAGKGQKTGFVSDRWFCTIGQLAASVGQRSGGFFFFLLVFQGHMRDRRGAAFNSPGAAPSSTTRARPGGTGPR